MVPSDDKTPEHFVPDYKNYIVCCDESGIDGAKYYGFGSLWMPWERRGDFSNLISTLRVAYGYESEIKWKKVGPRNEAFCRHLIGEFFRARWLMFHCLVVRKGYVDKRFHGNDPYDTARRKHFAMLLENKISFFSSSDRRKAYHAWVDPIASRYRKAGEAAYKIVNSTLKQRIKNPALHSLEERNSKDTPGIQVADLLLGAVVAAWNGEVSAAPKLNVMAEIARHLRWPDLRADTRRAEWKFNIWYFHVEPHGQSRECQTRPVTHLIPTPPYRRRR